MSRGGQRRPGGVQSAAFDAGDLRRAEPVAQQGISFATGIHQRRVGVVIDRLAEVAALGVDVGASPFCDDNTPVALNRVSMIICYAEGWRVPKCCRVPGAFLRPSAQRPTPCADRKSAGQRGESASSSGPIVRSEHSLLRFPGASGLGNGQRQHLTRGVPRPHVGLPPSTPGTWGEHASLSVSDSPDRGGVECGSFAWGNSRLGYPTTSGRHSRRSAGATT